MAGGFDDDNGKFRHGFAMGFAEPAHSQNRALARRRIVMHRDDRDFPVVVDKANPREPRVLRALLEGEVRKVAKVNALIRKRLVEPDHQRLILGSN